MSTQQATQQESTKLYEAIIVTFTKEGEASTEVTAVTGDELKNYTQPKQKVQKMGGKWVAVRVAEGVEGPEMAARKAAFDTLNSDDRYPLLAGYSETDDELKFVYLIMQKKA